MKYDLDDFEDSHTEISEEDYAALQARTQQARSSGFHDRYAKARTWQLKCLVLQAAYKHYLPLILEAAKAGRSIDPNIVAWEFSTTERDTWGEIRALGLPFYPRFPVLDYFADFADPFRKIVIEVNRSKPQNKTRDNLCEKLMREAGWEVYRLTGRTTMRLLGDAFTADEAVEIEEAINSKYPFSEANQSYLEMAESTLDGFLLVLRRRHYSKD